jgi:hypothetical protein
MSDTNPRPDHSVQFLRLFLIGTAVLVLGTSCLLALFWMANHDPSQSLTVLVSALCLLFGVTSAAVLIGASAGVGMLANLSSQPRAAAPVDDVRPALERLEQSLRTLNSMQSRAEPGRIDPAASHQGEKAAAHLDRLCDLMLMNDEQRKHLAERHWAHRKQIHLSGIEREVLVGDWPAAFARLEELQVVMPGDPQIAELRERVESEQNARLEEEVRVARGRLRQMMSATLWQQAEEMVAALQAKYPDKKEAERLGEDLRREREAFERESMERLFHDIAAATERRQWRQAILAVEEFIRRYPLDERAERLRLDMPMLQENAAAHERKDKEEQFKDLLKRQRYEEAIFTAKFVISKYPQSPTAVELNKLLPNVEELARQEALRVANQAAANAPAAA